MSSLSFLAASAFAQLTPDEAAARLQQLDAKNAAAATQPATITAAEVESLRTQIVALKAENADLRSQLAAFVELSQQAKKLKPPESTDERASDIQSFEEHVVGMKLDDAVAKMAALEAISPGDKPVLLDAAAGEKDYEIDTNSNWGLTEFHFSVSPAGVIDSFWNQPIRHPPNYIQQPQQ